MGGLPVDFTGGGTSTTRAIAGTTGRTLQGGNAPAPLLQGSSQVRRIRQAGSSLEPGQGQGFLGSIQAGADPNSFDELLSALLNNRNGLTGR